MSELEAIKQRATERRNWLVDINKSDELNLNLACLHLTDCEDDLDRAIAGWEASKSIARDVIREREDALGDLRIVQADRAVVRSELVQARADVLRGRASLKNKPLFDDDKQWLSDTESYEEYR